MKLPQVATTFGRCKHLIHVRSFQPFCKIILPAKEDLHHIKHAFIQEGTTRWNSAYYMVKCILEQQQLCCATFLEFRKGDLMPSEAEFNVMESYKGAKKPLVDATKAIHAEKWVTISIVRHKWHLKYSASDSRLVMSTMKEFICLDLERRYQHWRCFRPLDKGNNSRHKAQGTYLPGTSRESG